MESSLQFGISRSYFDKKMLVKYRLVYRSLVVYRSLREENCSNSNMEFNEDFLQLDCDSR